jgi:RNA polymerase sigma-70 factor (ECF subfamily)
MEPQAREIIQSVIERHSLMVYRLAYVRTGTRHDADDIYQEVFLRYITASPAFTCPEHEKAWFIRVTVNVSRNFLKSAWRKRTVTLTEEAGYMEDMFPGSASGLKEALSALPEKSRMVIHLHYYENMTAEEIAAALHLTAPAVRMILSRARKKLKKTLRKEEAFAHA